MAPYRLSKSKILSGLQCPKRLYLEVHRPELAETSEATELRFAVGHDVGEVARSLEPRGILIETGGDLTKALQETQAVLSGAENVTLFEATFEHGGVLVKADILGVEDHSRRLIEVKSSASVKDYHLPDVAVQYWVLKGAGFEPAKVELAHIDTSFVYPGSGDYRGLFAGVDMTNEAQQLQAEVTRWVREFKKVLAGDTPEVEIGNQCSDPFDCPFYGHCSAGISMPEYPVTILPRGGALAAELQAEGYEDLRDVPEGRLTRPIHQKVWRTTVTGSPELDPEAAKVLAKYPYPCCHLDFETIAFAVPIWAGTRPYQQIPFQWSCHVEHEDGSIKHHEFLDTSGNLPVKEFAEFLISSVGTSGPIFCYGAFEGSRLADLGAMLPSLAPELNKIRARLVDLLPLARKHYYHPKMKGSWSIKDVLPTVAPELDYSDLEIQGGDIAQQAYLEAIDPSTLPARREAIRQNLLEYCGRDTQALVSIVGFFKNAGEKKFSANLPPTGK
jgi:hypothetical protein